MDMAGTKGKMLKDEFPWLEYPPFEDSFWGDTPQKKRISHQNITKQEQEKIIDSRVSWEKDGTCEFPGGRCLIIAIIR